MLFKIATQLMERPDQSAVPPKTRLSGAGWDAGDVPTCWIRNSRRSVVFQQDSGFETAQLRVLSTPLETFNKMKYV